jgi:DNA-binding transcriptional LysR family regulator
VNLHHLELFHYVAQHGGISEAVRKIPYGIQQPAVSAQIIQLEAGLGTKLFQRRPFRLTAAGEKLYAFIQPFFGNVGKIAATIRGDSAQLVRVGASGPILRHHLPQVLETLRKKIPRLRLGLVEGTEPELIHSLKQDEIDLAVTSLYRPPPSGLNSQPLVNLPLTLLVPKKSRIRSAAELWKRDSIDEPLVSLPAHEPMSAIFREGLRKRGVDWEPSLIVSSFELIEIYVAKGFGIGLAVVVPGMKVPAGLRQIPLADFESLPVGAVWAGRPSPLVRTLVDAFREYVAAIRVKK